ncbi:MAG: transglutaminase-like domain-containing protein, partial [Thermoanaerobaculia bacterium]
DRKSLARKAAGDARTTVEKVRAVIDWANRNFAWTDTDYKSRTVDEIIERKGGNCNEQAMVVVALLQELGIRTRRVREINIQPESAERQKRAEEQVARVGVRASVFGLRHNDHVWTEFWDGDTNEWTPADPTLNLVGFDSWVKARAGFGARPTHPILPSRDMLVPIAIFAMNGATFEPRTERYLIAGLNAAYGGDLTRLDAWADWTRAIVTVQPAALGAFEGRVNLHEHGNEILAVKTAYEKLAANYAARSRPATAPGAVIPADAPKPTAPPATQLTSACE